MPDIEAPDNDVAEQELPVDPELDVDARTEPIVNDDVPEADAVEQAQPVPLAEDDEYR